MRHLVDVAGPGRPLRQRWPALPAEHAADQAGPVKKNIKLLYGFSFFDPFMIVIPVWVPYLATQGISMRQFRPSCRRSESCSRSRSYAAPAAGPPRDGSEPGSRTTASLMVERVALDMKESST